MSVQSRRTSRFHSLCDDQEDANGITNGQQCHFVVYYVGETAWREEFTYVNEIMETLLPKQTFGKFWSKKETKRKVCLFIDFCSTTVYVQNTEGVPDKFFRFCNIKEVIYCGHMKQYSKYLILVVNGEADSVVKAHIFSCGSVKEAKNAFKVFTDLFTHVSNEKPDSFDMQVEADIPNAFSDEQTSSPHHSLDIEKRRERQNNSLGSEKMSPEVEENVVDHAFTVLARSRSFTDSGHGKRYTPGSSKKLLRPYSLPAESPHY